MPTLGRDVRTVPSPMNNSAHGQRWSSSFTVPGRDMGDPRRRASRQWTKGTVPKTGTGHRPKEQSFAVRCPFRRTDIFYPGPRLQRVGDSLSRGAVSEDVGGSATRDMASDIKIVPCKVEASTANPLKPTWRNPFAELASHEILTFQAFPNNDSTSTNYYTPQEVQLWSDMKEKTALVEKANQAGNSLGLSENVTSTIYRQDVDYGDEVAFGPHHVWTDPTTGLMVRMWQPFNGLEVFTPKAEKPRSQMRVRGAQGRSARRLHFPRRWDSTRIHSMCHTRRAQETFTEHARRCLVIPTEWTASRACHRFSTSGSGEVPNSLSCDGCSVEELEGSDV